MLLKADMNAPPDLILPIVRRVTESSFPLLFWSGYSSLVLVHSAYLQAWTVVIQEEPRMRMYPRRWFDITGSRIKDIWEAALKAVVGVILFRPGISQVSLFYALVPYMPGSLGQIG
jgi:oxalate---CoA ligase